MSRKTISILGLIILGLAIILLMVMFIMPSMMKPTTTNPEVLAQLPENDTVSVVAQVMEIDRNILKIELLEGNGYNVFDKRTGVYLEAEQRPDVKFFMGTAADVQPGAIAQFDGTKLDADQIRLSRIVILSGYVQGPQEP